MTHKSSRTQQTHQNGIIFFGIFKTIRECLLLFPYSSVIRHWEWERTFKTNDTFVFLRRFLNHPLLRLPFLWQCCQDMAWLITTTFLQECLMTSWVSSLGLQSKSLSVSQEGSTTVQKRRRKNLTIQEPSKTDATRQEYGAFITDDSLRNTFLSISSDAFETCLVSSAFAFSICIFVTY